APRTILYRTPGRSFTRPPRTSTIECSWRLWPTPGMYAVTSTCEESFTRATLRRAEFGFLGVVVYTRVHTPRRWGEPLRAGVFGFPAFEVRPLRTSCWIVGTTAASSARASAPPCRRPRRWFWLVRADRMRHPQPPRGLLRHLPPARWPGSATRARRAPRRFQPGCPRTHIGRFRRRLAAALQEVRPDGAGTDS